jgi:hypothetical protein
MFVLTALVYPVVLALLCVGAGLLVDWVSGGVLAGMLLAVVGAGALIVVAQLSTYAPALAPATPYLLVAVAALGWALGRGRVRALAGSWRGSPWQLTVGPLAYALALAPVLLAGRATFSSYTALADSAVHMLGADFLVRHGQDYSHLDLRNSYGAVVHAYYGAGYPSGVDTLLGGSASLVGAPVIWAFQPFTAFALALATGPAWVLMRRAGLAGAWAAAAALTATLGALVYAYELIGSIKEIVAVALILGMGALVVEHRRWLWGGARGGIPFALLVAGGVGAFGVAFGAWALAAVVALAVAAAAPLARRASSPRALGGVAAVGGLVLLVGAWPTWAELGGSVHIAQAIASTQNPGNLHSPLRVTQLAGVWLGGSYKLLPTGVALTLTSMLVGVVFAVALVGVGRAVRSRWWPLAAWFAAMLIVWWVVTASATTWGDAKALMLTSPVVVAMAWVGIATLRGAGGVGGVLASLVAFALVGGVVVSDALQYHDSNLAPTARYEELAAVDERFAGRGPTLFTDFDEYALYELRDMDVGGPNFAYPPPALAYAAGGHGTPVALDRVAPAALVPYPLIVTRRDPSAARPPAAYGLLWRGVYYEVWGRRPAVAPALAHVALAGRGRAQCTRLGRLAAAARGRRGALVVSRAPGVVAISIARSRRTAGWTRARAGFELRRPGSLHAAFALPRGGVWEVWLRGDVMRALRVSIDGRALGSVGGELGGNSLVPNTLAPLRARLSAGRHTLTIARPGTTLAPGDGGAAVLGAVFLTPAGRAGEPALRTAALRRWRSLCGPPLQWVELLGPSGGVARARLGSPR